MNYNDSMRKARMMDGQDYDDHGGNYGGREGYGERDSHDMIEKAICKGIKHGMKKALEFMEDNDDDDEYGERRGVRGTGRFSRVRRY